MNVTVLDKINIADSIRQVLAENNISISWLAQNIPCDRSSLYRMLKRQNFDLYTLCRISILLEYNFLEKCSSAIMEEVGNINDG